MKFLFFNQCGYDVWDWRAPDITGIGASETAQVEMTWRLAARGHEIVSFSPIGYASEWKGVDWQPTKKVKKYLKSAGIWVVSRSPQFLEELPPMEGRKVWFVCQDVEYGDTLTKERLERIDRLFALCPVHADYLAHRYPTAKDKITISSNGIRCDVIEELDQGIGLTEPIERNPLRLVYTSSPDRGLLPLLKIVKRAREFAPSLELTVCYGFDNLEKHADPIRKKYIADIKRQLEAPGITHLGRLSQDKLYRLLLSAGMWVYPTDFTETSCVSCMEAQALGCVPVFSPIWAQEHNVGHGIMIRGAADDPLTRARFARAIVRLAWFPQLQEQIRAEMMPWARRQFDYERIADHYEAMAYEPCRGGHAC